MQEENVNISWIGWVIVLLSYEIGLLFMLFGMITFGQVLFYGTIFYAIIFALRIFFRDPLTTLLAMIISSKL